LLVDGGTALADADVVAMERDVQGTEMDVHPAALRDEGPQSRRKRDAARVDANERELVEILCPLDQLVRDPRQRAIDGLGVEQRLRRLATGGAPR